MTDLISTHSYINTSCLQVFLYTNVDNLFKEAAFYLSKSSHQDPLFAIVASLEQKEALLAQIYNQNGFTSFTNIDTLSNTLVCLLNKYSLKKQRKIHDKISLTFAIYELILKKDPATFFLKIDENLLLDLDSVFTIAKNVASELFELLEITPDTSDETALFLQKSIKSLCPDILFQDEVIKICKPYLDRLVFIGFTYLPISYLHLLKESKARLFLLVPSLAFLGDVLSGKQKLKNLREQVKRLDKSFVFEEHPLLENLSALEKQFYNEIAQLNEVYSEDDPQIEPQTALEKLQFSLKTGFYDGLIESDDSIQIIDVKSHYEKCTQVISALQIIFKDNLSISQNDICIIANYRDYAPILNSLGETLENPIQFTTGYIKDPVWEVLEMLIFIDEKEQNQNFFIKLICKLKNLSKSFKLLNVDKLSKLLQLVQASHLSGIGFELTGQQYLKALKEAFLRSKFFELEKNQQVYELNFLEGVDLNAEDVFELIDHVESALHQFFRMKQLVLLPHDWIKELSSILRGALFADFITFDFYKKLFSASKDIHVNSIGINCNAFFSLITHLFVNLYNNSQAISIYDGSKSLNRTYKYLFFLNDLNIDNKKSRYFLKNFINSRHQAIIFNLPNSQLIIFTRSLLYENNLISTQLSLVVDCLPSKKNNTNNLLVPCQMVLRKEFLNDQLIEQATLMLKDEDRYLDFNDVLKFFHNKEKYIKKHWLQIRNSELLLEADISQRSLLKWLYQKFGHNLKGLFLDPFIDSMNQEEKDEYLRSQLISSQDLLTHNPVKEALNLNVDMYNVVKIQGYVDKISEEKVIEKKEVCLSFLKLKKIICG